ncbi:MAG TPA: dienelactone hydrolase family protein [Rhodocyclaceae bacterium]|nr:dienelactone hydrolase family protein [Rhodocyclaceae bacterium]
MNNFLRSLTLCMAIFASSAHAAAPQQISVPTAGVSSSPNPLIGFLFKPEGPGPHPAIVMMHGCGGAYEKNGTLNVRHIMWGDYFAQQGYVALMLDSFTSRGFKEICTVKFGERTLKEADRVGDAYAALAFLRQRNDVDAKRIAVLGWSHGAGSVLSTISTKPKSGEGFKAAVSFYPGCTTKAKRPERFHPYAPLLVLIGESDDWTPAEPCKTLTAAVAARGEPMQIVTYPDTYHDFDNPGITKKHVRKEVPNGVHPGQGVTTAPNPVAREDAKKRVSAFFAEQLK